MLTGRGDAYRQFLTTMEFIETNIDIRICISISIIIRSRILKTQISTFVAEWRGSVFSLSLLAEYPLKFLICLSHQFNIKLPRWSQRLYNERNEGWELFPSTKNNSKPFGKNLVLHKYLIHYDFMSYL